MAAALTLIAIVACGTPAMGYRQIRHPIWHDPPAQFALDHRFGHHAPTGESHGGQELAIRHLRQAFVGGAHADEAFDEIIIRCKLPVADGPVFAVTVAASRFELVVAIAIALACPTKGFAANLAAADPQERFVGWKGIRILEIIHEELMTVLVAGVTQALYGLCAKKLLLVPKSA